MTDSSGTDLAAFTDGVDTYVAESVEEAMKMQRDFLGLEVEDQFRCEWKELPLDRELKIICEDDNDKVVTKTVADWIKTNGRGFLSSKNF